jgi:hypothetical protein
MPAILSGIKAAKDVMPAMLWRRVQAELETWFAIDLRRLRRLRIGRCPMEPGLGLGASLVPRRCEFSQCAERDAWSTD